MAAGCKRSRTKQLYNIRLAILFYRAIIAGDKQRHWRTKNNSILSYTFDSYPLGVFSVYRENKMSFLIWQIICYSDLFKLSPHLTLNIISVHRLFLKALCYVHWKLGRESKRETWKWKSICKLPPSPISWILCWALSAKPSLDGSVYRTMRRKMFLESKQVEYKFLCKDKLKLPGHGHPRSGRKK